MAAKKKSEPPRNAPLRTSQAIYSASGGLSVGPGCMFLLAFKAANSLLVPQASLIFIVDDSFNRGDL
jgi:hypothetical protein